MSKFGVIFDMDGVLVDSYRAHFESWQVTAQGFGLAMQEQEFARTFGQTSRDIIQKLWPGRLNDAQMLQFDEKKEHAYREILQRHFPAMPGAPELLQALHVAGFAMAIGSSGPPQNVEVVRKCLPNGNLILAAVNGREVVRGKPDPQVFLLAAGKLGLPAANCAVVEDAPVGVEAASRAGMVAIGITGTVERTALAARGADLVIDRLCELSPDGIRRMIENRVNATPAMQCNSSSGDR